jgi:hypothetical protein
MSSAGLVSQRPAQPLVEVILLQQVLRFCCMKSPNSCPHVMLVMWHMCSAAGPRSHCGSTVVDGLCLSAMHVTVHLYAKLSMMHEASCAPSKHCCPLDHGGTRPDLLALPSELPMQDSCPACEASPSHVPVVQRDYACVHVSAQKPCLP